MKIGRGSLAMLALSVLVVVAAGCGSSAKSPVGPGPINTAPSVSSTNPVDGATNVSDISASFSTAMDATTITGTTFVVTGAAGAVVPGNVSYSSATDMATFVPAAALVDGTDYVATLTTGVKDVSGNALASNLVWHFRKGPPSTGMLAPALGSAANFVILAGSTVTSTGLTTLTGDLGVSPGSAVTGFPPGILTGTKHAADPTSALAIADLTIAYNDAAGRTLAPVMVAGNLGGRTLTPGLYKSTSSLAISSGDLTLDAQGNANAVFIFQMATTFTTTPGRAVILAGGAKASNVFWQVGSSATLGTTSVIKGTIMANASISMANGATLNGRALARIGAVTMIGNAAVLPTP
jgi:hypothetical protein